MILRIVASSLRGFWEEGLPDEVLTSYTGGHVELRETIRGEGLDPEGEPPEVVADLGAFGGSEILPLEPVGEGVFRLEHRLELGEATGVKTLVVRIAQEVGGERFETRVKRVFEVLPGRDLVVVGEALAPGWQLAEDKTLQLLGFGGAPSVFRGAAAAFEARDVTFSGWNLALEPVTPVDAWRLTTPEPMEQIPGAPVNGDLRMQSVAMAEAAPVVG